MKNKFFILGLISLLSASAIASEVLTTSDASSREFLINHGHSTAISEAVQRSKSQATGTAYDAPPKKEYPAALKFINDVLMYFDPALDTDTFMNHDTKFTPQLDDL